MEADVTYLGVCQGCRCDEIVIGRLACDEHMLEVAYEHLGAPSDG